MLGYRFPREPPQIQLLTRNLVTLIVPTASSSCLVIWWFPKAHPWLAYEGNQQRVAQTDTLWAQSPNLTGVLQQITQAQPCILCLPAYEHPRVGILLQPTSKKWPYRHGWYGWPTTTLLSRNTAWPRKHSINSASFIQALEIAQSVKRVISQGRSSAGSAAPMLPIPVQFEQVRNQCVYLKNK